MKKHKKNRKIIYVVCYQHEPDCPTDFGPVRRDRKVAVKDLDAMFRGLIYPDGVDDDHGYDVEKEGNLVISFSDPEGGPAGYIEEREVE